ncbi:CTLH/CRA C-terminal to lish motif domain-containing protein [Chytridium lagenaria]|nr:CTLH/CRA C-terminal to lish motif domain-containing protein [Chytridium lagenaria]
MEALAKEFDKVTKKQKICADTTADRIDKLIAAVEAARNNIVSQPPSTSPDQMRFLIKSTAISLSGLSKETSTQIAESHKELYGAFSKYGKAVDKKFKIDLDNIKWDPKAFDSPEKERLLHKAIALHSIRDGNFDLADKFIAEACVDIPDSLKAQFQDMFHILESLRAGSLDPAINWARIHREELESKGSSLEFDLLVKEALEYAKHNFGRFSGSHFKEIQRLMCSVLFRSRLSKSPYSDLLDLNLWTDVQHNFAKNFCTLLGLPSESPLLTSVTLGISALPSIIKMSEVLKDKGDMARAQMTELPIEIPLPDFHRYHSVFTCPVSKEQATEDNPPMMMVCGHVLCKESLTRISKGNSSLRFKCPYCPSESTAAQALRVSF